MLGLARRTQQSQQMSSEYASKPKFVKANGNDLSTPLSAPVFCSYWLCFLFYISCEDKKKHYLAT